MRSSAVALLHHPVLDRQGEVLTTTFTNLDLHDMARSVRSYGLDALYIVHPHASQRMLAERVLAHWLHGAGGKRIPARAEALSVVRVVETLADAVAQHGGPHGAAEVWTTAARRQGEVTSFADARALLDDAAAPPMLLCFGTGWGIASQVIEAAAHRLEPIDPPGGGAFNHLSVRAACAIALDRLFG